MFVLVIFSAGTTPATTAARSVSQAEYVRVVAESPPSNQNGQPSASVLIAASAHFNAKSVAVKPSTAAMAASTSASANSCITIRLRAAPRARRTRISRSRVAARANINSATLPQTTTRNNAPKALIE